MSNMQTLAKAKRSQRSGNYHRKVKVFFFASLLVFGTVLCLELRNSGLVNVCKVSITGIPAMLHIHFLTEWLLSPWFYSSLVIALIAERLIPAERPTSTSGQAYKFFYDLMWIPPKFLFFATLWPLYMAIVQWMVQEHLSMLCVKNAESIPWLIRVVGGLLLVDFLDWGTHIVRHKIRVFWAFHSIHHSQTKLNFFTEYRSHVLDDLLKWTLEAIPLILLQHTILDVLTINRLRYWHTTIYHSNIRSNYGFLKYILVTPQSHRIHHSRRPEHFDKNFGLTFSIWDHLFGTQYRNYDEYPETGIASKDSPIEPASPQLSAGLSFLEQFFYPVLSFKRAAKPEPE